eukprot:CAMPEP_0206046806 /NCGR_PEP_ID=MMETSP1466-20131121/19585_1 /ASSEMBLY_ACC=CAM_ASM_001126 /TAXON_ID=44452 /ORGANISM="Pavlova gyrans, Strain CCMP608" /LENGTH=526 /DNA_ID=CAMNT_0053421795 /DNA_START=153 /DNA_END=1733 /DNA_ORIENTATION=+
MLAAAARKDTVAVCFFGLNRSLKWVIGDIQRRILRPLKRDCLVPELYVHTYSLNATLASRRSGESGGLSIGGWKEMRDVLQPFALEVTDQNELITSYRRHPPFTAGLQPVFRSPSTARNWLAQLYSLLRVTVLWLPRANKLSGVVFVRPDLRPLDSLDTVALASAAPNEIFIPWWHSWRGANDRFAFGQPRAAAAYGLRMLLLMSFTTEGLAHSEEFNKFALNRSGVNIRYTSGRAQRVRATGATEKRDIGLSRVSWTACARTNFTSAMYCTRSPMPHEVRAHASAVLLAVRKTGSPYNEPPDDCVHIPDYAAVRRRAFILLITDEATDTVHTANARRIRATIIQPLQSACVIIHVVIFQCHPLSAQAAASWRSALDGTLLGQSEVSSRSCTGTSGEAISPGELRLLALRAIHSNLLLKNSYIVIALDTRQTMPVGIANAFDLFRLRYGQTQVVDGFVEQPDMSGVAMCQVHTALAYVAQRPPATASKHRVTPSTTLHIALPWFIGGFIVTARGSYCARNTSMAKG